MRKLMILMAAVAAIGALAVSASAASAATARNSEGVALKNGTEVTALSTNLKTHTSGGTLECEEVTLAGKVANNGGNPLEGKEVTSTAHNKGGGPCTVSGNPFVSSATIEKITVGTISFFNDHTDSTTMEFEYTLNPLGLKCHLGGTVATTWTSGSSVDVVGPSKLTGGGASGCPTEGTIEGSFTFNNGVTINDV